MTFFNLCARIKIFRAREQESTRKQRGAYIARKKRGWFYIVYTNAKKEGRKKEQRGKTFTICE